MQEAVLFCKSYRDDVLRARRLIESVARFNGDGLALYLSVPAVDIALFREKCTGLPFNILADEEIVSSSPQLDPKAFARLPGRISQQIVKAEFWRAGFGDTYVCLDSDCYFLKPFRAEEFVSPDGTPYTVMQESKELLNVLALLRMENIVKNRERECVEIKSLFARQGRCWDFGPVPVVWSGRVWKDLDEKFLRPRSMTILDAINTHPGELRWYGEALLAFGSIPILPIEPLFRCYHYEEQYYFWRRLGETDETIAKNYLGVCMQSNWDKDLDLVKRFKFSKLRRRIKRAITEF
jgi:hypothetical protein